MNQKQALKGHVSCPFFYCVKTIQGAEKGVQGFPLPLGEHHRPGTQRAGSYGVIMWRKLKIFGILTMQSTQQLQGGEHT